LHITFEWSQSKAVQRPAAHVGSTGGVICAVQVSAKQFGRLHFGPGSALGMAKQLQQSLMSLHSFESVHSATTPPPADELTLPDELDVAALPVPASPPTPVEPPLPALLEVVTLDVEALLAVLLAPVEWLALAVPRVSTEESQAAAMATEAPRRSDARSFRDVIPHCRSKRGGAASPSWRRSARSARMRGRRLLAFSIPIGFWVACVPPGPKGDGAGSGGAGTPSPAAQCQAFCEAEHPDAVTAYRALSSCLLCDACHDRCGAELPAACGAMELGCSADATDCASCIASPCALEQQPDTTFKGACALAGAECAASTGCVALNNCVASCVVSTGPGSTGSGGAGGAAPGEASSNTPSSSGAG